MKRGPSPTDIQVFRGFISKDNRLGVFKPPQYLSIRTVFSNVEKGKPYEFIYIAFCPRIETLVPVPIVEKYQKYTRYQFLRNPKKCGVKIYKTKNGQIKFF